MDILAKTDEYAYRTLKYSDSVQDTISAGAPVVFAENKFNRYTFKDGYNGTTITSGNTVRNGYNDTLIFTDSKFGDGSLSLKLVDGEAGQKDLQITSNGKTVTYKNYITGNNSEIVLIDSDNRKVSVAEYTDKLLTTHFEFVNRGGVGTYNAVFIKDDGTHGYNESVKFYLYGKTHNYIHTEGGIKLDISQQGKDCHSTFVSASVANDTYETDLKSNLLIEENGGVDTLQVSVGEKPDGEIYSWDNAVAQTVGTWLHSNNYESVADVVENHADRLNHSHTRMTREKQSSS